MKWPTLNCPFCGGTLRNTDVYPGRPIVCPDCKAQLQPSDRQMWLSGFIALCIVIAVLYLFDVSGVWLIVATILLWFPAYVIWAFVFVRIVPPRFEAYVPKDHKGGLFGN